MASRQQFGSFYFDPDSADRMARKGQDWLQKLDAELGKRMKKAVQIVWTIAHQKRPMITAADAKAMGYGKVGRIDSKTGKKRMVQKRVSNPDAEAGVPVDTGNLQAHVKSETIPGKIGKITGRIYVEAVEYALAMEFGVPSKNIRARPYMRPAIDLARPALNEVFRAPMK